MTDHQLDTLIFVLAILSKVVRHHRDMSIADRMLLLRRMGWTNLYAAVYSRYGEDYEGDNYN